MNGMDNESLDLELVREAPQRGVELSALVEKQLPLDTNLRMEVTLALPREGETGLRAGLRIGQDKVYVVRDLPAFLQAWHGGFELPFQSRFTYEPSWMRFSTEDEEILELLDRVVSAWRAGKNLPGQNESRMIRLPEWTAEELLARMRRRHLRVMRPDGSFQSSSRIPEGQLPIQADCRLTPRGLQITFTLQEKVTPMTENCAWVLTEDGIRAVPEIQRELVRFLHARQMEGRVMVDYPMPEISRAVSETLPWLKSRCAVDMSEELRQMLERKPLLTRIYLDRDGRSAVAKVIFQYGDREVNPFAHESGPTVLKKGEKLLLRDGAGEHAVLSG